MSENQKIALVTGASRGIGQAILRQLAEMGSYVIGTATTESGAESITQYLKEAGLKGEGRLLNVAAVGTIDDFVKDLVDQKGAPAILVNNAGITRDNLLMRMSDEEWDLVISTNLTGLFHLTKACIRPMMKARFGRVVNVGSVVGYTGNPGQSNYCASKAGVLGFSKALALEIASRGITVNVVAPGFIETDMTGKLTEEQKSAILAQVPMARMGKPDDIAAAVRFLVSDAAGYITGVTLHVNGGMYLA